MATFLVVIGNLTPQEAKPQASLGTYFISGTIPGTGFQGESGPCIELGKLEEEGKSRN